MNQKIETLNKNDLEVLSKSREWLAGHFDDAHEYENLSTKLKLVQTILDNEWVSNEETFKLQALGICLGDALAQEMEELSWVAVEDEYGRDPALRWLNTSVLIFPRTSVSKRIEAGIKVDIYEMFGGFQKTIHSALKNQA